MVQVPRTVRLTGKVVAIFGVLGLGIGVASRFIVNTFHQLGGTGTELQIFSAIVAVLTLALLYFIGPVGGIVAGVYSGLYGIRQDQTILAALVGGFIGFYTMVSVALAIYFLLSGGGASNDIMSDAFSQSGSGDTSIDPSATPDGTDTPTNEATSEDGQGLGILAQIMLMSLPTTLAAGFTAWITSSNPLKAKLLRERQGLGVERQSTSRETDKQEEVPGDGDRYE